MRLLLSITLAVQAVATATVPPDPLDIFRPVIVVRPAQRQALDSGTPIITLPPAQGRDLAVFSAIAIDNQAPRRRASRWMRQIEQLRRNPNVVSTGRFSTPIAATDVEGLTLDARDVDDIRTCRPGRVLRNADGSRRYLVHVHRSEVDLLDGFWGGLTRSAIASRIRKDGPAALEAARHRLSAVDPPSP